MVALPINTFERFLSSASGMSRAGFQADSFVETLSVLLGWQSDSTSTEILRRHPFGGHMLRASIATEPAFLFFAHDTSVQDDIVFDVAGFAYHSSIEWGLIASPDNIVLFNSHWTVRDRWFTLPAISRKDLLAKSNLLAALSPSSLRTGHVEQLAFEYRRPDHVLVPVDDHLVDTLDRWRDETMRYARDVRAVDEILQSLFSQLFVLRAIEDRGLARNVPRLDSCLSPEDDVDVSQLKALFESARHSIQSELFDSTLLDSIPTFVIAGVIRDLYLPRDFPVANVRYNFAWIDADVLGTAYEKYLATLLVPRDIKEQQLNFLDHPKRDVSRISHRKASGVYYTPEFIVRFLVSQSVDEYFADRADIDTPIPRIADIACGSGSFLVAAANHVITRLRERDPQAPWGRRLIDEQRLVGVDIDPRAVTLARLSLWLRLAEEPDPLPLPSLSQCIISGDSLDAATWQRLPSEIDIILGNPPFVPTGRIRDQNSLALQFETARGRYDYAFLFVEQAIKHLSPFGRLALVVPNRVFTNAHAAALRRLLSEQTSITILVDFGVNEVFEGINAYIGLLCAHKVPPTDNRVRVIKVNSLPSRFSLYPLVIASNTSDDIDIEGVRGYDSRYSTDGMPWALLSKRDRLVRLQFESSNEPLNSIATVFQGVKTGANDIFVLNLIASGPVLSECRNSMGDTIPIETEFLRPVIYGAEIRRYDVVAATRVLIYPYENGRVIIEDALRLRAPRLFEYLSEYERFLRSRRTVQTHSRSWYELAWQRDYRLMESRKIVIRDLATEPAFAIDDTGGIYLIGGTGIVPENEDYLESLWAYLNSAFAGWYLRTTAPGFRAGFQKFEPGTISQLPVPHAVWQPGELRDTLRTLSLRAYEAKQLGDEYVLQTCEGEVDSLLAKALGISVEDIR